jgi:protein-S-isoprenylcysteine O-methyltransferase Ste14
MFLRALFAFLVLPGVVAFAVPIWWLITSSRTEPQHAWGWALLLVGCAGLLWCVRDFYVFGKGTLAPWSPPQHLVTSGLYRYSRNPMYVSVVLILLGWTVTFDAWRGLGVYAAIVAVVFHFRVVLFEEPWLARTHGEVWNDYLRRVRRWL